MTAPPVRAPDTEAMLERESIANRKKHWVRAVTACNSKCLFCLDADTPRNVYLPESEVKADLLRGREELDADKVIISGGEASLHPSFIEFIRYAKSIGYDRVQTVTNGYRYANKDFYRECMDAGLGEITYSLHGHTAELHDYLTQTPGAFKRLMKSMVRALRDPRGPIVNVDVVINKQNVGVLDKIVELAISVGVTEFDLLHVIPQSNAYDNREEMFYDPEEYLPILHKVFRLNRHPRFVIWTNRFPVPWLEGLEDLIQDPHKMLDEVNGRRFMVRNYLDTGRKLDCREAERCPHCFIAPFCDTMDRTIDAQRAGDFDVWTLPEWSAQALNEAPSPLPFGIHKLGVHLQDWSELSAAPVPHGTGLELTLDSAGPLPADLPENTTVVLRTVEQCAAWLGAEVPAGVDLVVELNQATAPWMLDHRDTVATTLATGRLRIHQPAFEHMKDAVANDIEDPAAFFAALALPVPTSGLPVCGTPGAVPVADHRRLGATMFDLETGRIQIKALAKAHVSTWYRSKSVRCKRCPATDRCEGFHINQIRTRGLQLCRPLQPGPSTDTLLGHLEALHPQPILGVTQGTPHRPPAPSLPGFAMPEAAVTDPLAAVAQKLKARREARARARATGEAVPANPFSPKGAATS
jgi:pyruvate-formate lyase-activating enzyme